MVKWKSIAVGGLLGLGTLLLLGLNSSAPLGAQEEREEKEVSAKARAAKLIRFKRQLADKVAELKKALAKAKKDKDEAEIKKLRDVAEELVKEQDEVDEALAKLRKQLGQGEKKEKEGTEEKEGEEEGEFEHMLRRLEAERLELETQRLRLKLAQERAKVAKDPLAAAAIALDAAQAGVDEDDIVDYLTELLKKAKYSTANRRLIQLRLIQVAIEHERGDAVKEQLESLILGKK